MSHHVSPIRPSRLRAPTRDVFLNVPFDRRYNKLLEALIFAVHDCGFIARSAREEDDGSEVRMAKLYKIIGDCRLAIHDLSRTSLDTRNRLPRFNMLDREPFRYQVFCSDIAGQDIRAHQNDAGEAIRAVRNWLRITHPGLTVPGSQRMRARYLEFRRELPAMAKRAKLAVPELSFLDYRIQVVGWLHENIL